MSKGPQIRKGTNFPNLRAGYDNIDWGREHDTRRETAAAKRREAEERRKRMDEHDENALREALEIRKRLSQTYSNGIEHNEVVIEV